LETNKEFKEKDVENSGKSKGNEENKTGKAFSPKRCIMNVTILATSEMSNGFTN
jgi:hypothetical protein